jgi:hypothetical protein
MTGRRSTDVVEYDDLPIATEPDIPAIDGMIEAGYSTWLDWASGPTCGAWLPRFTAQWNQRGARRRGHHLSIGASPMLHNAGMPTTWNFKPHRRRTDGIGGTDGA